MRRSAQPLLPVVIACMSMLAALTHARAHAQDIRDVVRQHVANQLEGTPDDKRDKPNKPEPKPDKPAPKDQPKPTKPTAKTSDKPVADKQHGGLVFSTDSTDATKPAANDGPKLPLRVFGKGFQLDLTLGGGYRGWVPQQYQTVKVDAGSYWVWTFDVKAKLFKFLNLHRSYYESNAISGPRTDEAAVASQVGKYIPKAAWLLGVLGFPLFKYWEPIIRYESRAFHTQAHPQQPVCVVTDKVAGDLSTCARSRNELDMTSGFETLVFGVTYDKSKDPTPVIATRTEKLPPLTFGIGLMQYRKPYQVSINGNTLNDYLFDGRFRGAGLYFGTELGGGPDRIYLSANAQLGLGEIALTKSLTLNSLAPEDWLIGYVQGTVEVGYYLPITRVAPTLMFVPMLSGGGASFFFFKTQQKTGEKSDAAGVNWDFLWTVHAALVLSL